MSFIHTVKYLARSLSCDTIILIFLKALNAADNGYNSVSFLRYLAIFNVSLYNKSPVDANANISSTICARFSVLIYE